MADVWLPSHRVPRGQRFVARRQCRPGVPDPAAPENSGSLVDRIGLCDSSRERGNGGLDQRTEEHVVDAVLRGGDTSLSAILRRRSMAVVRVFVTGIPAG